MNKKLLIIPAAVIIILSHAACGKFNIAERKQVKSNFSQSEGQKEGQAENYQKAAAAETEKSDVANSKNEEANNAAVIYDLIKTLVDMDSTVNSLEDAADEDLKVIEPQ